MIDLKKQKILITNSMISVKGEGAKENIFKCILDDMIEEGRSIKQIISSTHNYKNYLLSDNSEIHALPFNKIDRSEKYSHIYIHNEFLELQNSDLFLKMLNNMLIRDFENYEINGSQINSFYMEYFNDEFERIELIIKKI